MSLLQKVKDFAIPVGLVAAVNFGVLTYIAGSGMYHDLDITKKCNPSSSLSKAEKIVQRCEELPLILKPLIVGPYVASKLYLMENK